MDLFVEIVYVVITVVLILVVLLQAGRGGGLGTALGGGASQGVFGGGGGADFLAKLTQGLAAGFMICAVYLAYASAHSGSDRLQAASDDTEQKLVDEDEEVDYERIAEPGGVPLELPPADAKVVAPSDIAEEAPVEPATDDENEAPEGGQDAEGAVEALPPTEPEADAPSEPAEAEAVPEPEAAEPAAPAEPATDAEAPTAEAEPTSPDAP